MRYSGTNVYTIYLSYESAIYREMAGAFNLLDIRAFLMQKYWSGVISNTV